MSKNNDSSINLKERAVTETFEWRGHPIRVVRDEHSEKLLAAQDIAHVLGYRNAPDMLRTIPTEQRDTHIVRISHDSNDFRRMAVITKAGFYTACLKRETSCIKDPAAQRDVMDFQMWVTEEVLPSIDRSGSYSLPQASAPALSGKALLAAAVLEAQKTIENLEAENKELKPKALYADMVGAGENTLTMPQMAKILSSHGFPGGVVKLYRKLREDHVVYRKNGRNLPCQRYVDAGLFTARISPYEAKGHHYNGVTTLVTPKGSRWLAARYCPAAAALGESGTPVLEAAPAPTWESAFFVEGERGYQGEGYPILHVFADRKEAEDWAATHHGQPIDNKQGKQAAEDIAGLRVEALGWRWDGTLDGLRALPAADDAEFAQAVADTYALDAGPWTGGIIFHY